MIRISALHPNQPGKRFDMEYFTEKHMPLVRQRLDSTGLIRAEVDKGLGTAEPGAPAPFIAVAHLYFNSMEEVHKAFEAHGHELMGDRPNFAELEPQIQISEIVS